MKNKKLLFLKIGLFKFIIFYIVTTGAMYYSLVNFTEYLWLGISVFLAFIHVIVFAYLNKSLDMGIMILTDFLSSCLSFALIILELILRNVVEFNILPRYITDQLDDNYGAGIMILLSFGMYCVSVLVLKLIMIVVMAIRRYYKNQTDISDIPPPSNQGTVL